MLTDIFYFLYELPLNLRKQFYPSIKKQSAHNIVIGG